MFGSEEYVSCLAREYGCQVLASDAQVRILVTITPNNASQLEPDLHLGLDTMRIAYQAIRHTHWLEAVSSQGPLKELIRVVKDVRRRFPGLQYLNIWSIQYLVRLLLFPLFFSVLQCWWCMMRLPDRTPLPLGPAFRRVFQLLAAGLFLPNAPILTDPTEPTQGIGCELTRDQMVGGGKRRKGIWGRRQTSRPTSAGSKSNGRRFCRFSTQSPAVTVPSSPSLQ